MEIIIEPVVHSLLRDYRSEQSYIKTLTGSTFCFLFSLDERRDDANIPRRWHAAWFAIRQVSRSENLQIS